MPTQHLDPALAGALEARGYATLTPVQLAVLETEALGRDLLVSARTGSGKTVAYGLALAPTLLGADGRLPPQGAPRALVIAPTRELAMQVRGELQWLYAGAVIVSCVGGMDPRSERRALEQGCQIVVGTPGRLRDHLERGQLRLGELGAVILDEADEMLDLGFREELEEILDATPASRRTLLFSATLPRAIVAMAGAYQTNALRLVVGSADTAHSDIEYRAVRCAPNEVELAVVNVLRYFESGSALVFCATREAVRKLHADLVERGFSVVALSGELTQNERTHALQALRDRRARVCVATDVAARGIDIPDLDLVIHADLPTNREALQHRSGRTGRAGRKGVCVILAPHPKRRRLEMLLKAANIQAQWQSAPTAEEITARDQLRLIEAVAGADQASEEDRAVARALMERRSAEDIATAYVSLARSRTPAPEDLSEAEPTYTPYSPGQSSSRAPSQGRADPPRAGFEDAVWFRIDLGRNKNAEARWLLPMICRRGHVTKTDIGAIRVFERESRFQIAAAAVERFEAAAAKSDGDGGRIHRLAEGGPPPERAAAGPVHPRPPYKSPKRGPDEAAQPAPSWRPDRADAGAPSPDRAAVDSPHPRPPFKGPKRGPAAPVHTAPWRPDRPPKPFKAKRSSKKGKPNG